MSEKRTELVLLFVPPVLLSLILLAQSVLVEIDFDTCFGNYAASVNGDRPYERVGEMSVGELVDAAGKTSADQALVVGALGLLPLLPFIAAWLLSRSGHNRTFWLLPSLVVLALSTAWIAAQELTSFHDCDRKGISLGILAQPILITAITSAAVIMIAALRRVIRPTE